MTEDVVNHPSHYNTNDNGIETIEITQHLDFCIGNAVKYLSRAELKGNRKQDIEKAIWYITKSLESDIEDTWRLREIGEKAVLFVSGTRASDKVRAALFFLLTGFNAFDQHNKGAFKRAKEILLEDISNDD